MQSTKTHRLNRVAEVPEDLRLFEERLSHLGIRAILPNAGPNDPLPPLEDIPGTPLSVLIIRARDGDKAE
jgi:hypothetical protein